MRHCYYYSLHLLGSCIYVGSYVNQYPQTAVFFFVVGLAICLVVWTLLLTLTPSFVGILQVVQKSLRNNRVEGKTLAKMDLELQNSGGEVWHF